MKKMNFTIQINDRGGAPFRKYTPDTLVMLFQTSKTAANFELMVLIEGLSFLAYYMHLTLNGRSSEYDEKADFADVIDKLEEKKIIGKKLKGKLHSYRKQRNQIVHDLFRIKSFHKEPDFKNYSYEVELEKLFWSGMNAFDDLYKRIMPSKDFDVMKLAERLKGSKLI